jgi:threonine aldolase
MAEAEVGDDVFGDDPTVNRLQEMAADRVGMEAALYVPSGSMANHVAVKCWTRPGCEVILEAACHILNNECAGVAVHSQAAVRSVQGVRGIPWPEDVAAAIRKETDHAAGTALMCLENTHNAGGGTVLPLATLKQLRGVAKAAGIPIHMDGARIFNASVASGVPVREYAGQVDSLSFCLSKGLSAPVGSLVCGPADFIKRARRVRKLLGGGMRQAGVIAAAGIVALETMVERLAEDHANARLLVEGLAELKGICVEPEAVETNILYGTVTKPGLTAPALFAALKERGVLGIPMGPQRFRLVTHKDVSRDDTTAALRVFGEVLSG